MALFGVNLLFLAFSLSGRKNVNLGSLGSGKLSRERDFHSLALKLTFYMVELICATLNLRRVLR